MKAKIELSGVIKFVYNDFGKIKLEQIDGYRIDLVSRFNEANESFPDKKLQVSYWLSDTVCSKNDMLEGWLKQISGAVEAEYQTNSYNYSSWTHGTDYDTVLRIGGHDLYTELIDQEGKFLILEINVD